MNNTWKIVGLTIAMLVLDGCSDSDTKKTNVNNEASDIQREARIQQAKKIRENSIKAQKDDYNNPKTYNVSSPEERSALERKLILEKNARFKSKNGPDIIIED